MAAVTKTTLIERCRLTEEELRAIYDSNMSGRGRCGYRDFSEAQLGKALWAVAEFLHPEQQGHIAKDEFLLWQRADGIRSELEAAGIERPKGAG